MSVAAGAGAETVQKNICGHAWIVIHSMGVGAEDGLTNRLIASHIPRHENEVLLGLILCQRFPVRRGIVRLDAGDGLDVILLTQAHEVIEAGEDAVVCQCDGRRAQFYSTGYHGGQGHGAVFYRELAMAVEDAIACFAHIHFSLVSFRLKVVQCSMVEEAN